MLDLSEFVSRCCETYRSYDRSELICDRLKGDRLEMYSQIFQEEAAILDDKVNSRHPYASLPNHCFWKRSVSRVPANKVDPVVEGTITISNEHKVATAGSCFAQHIAKRLKRSGFNYFVTELAPKELTEEESNKKGYGLFSGRYGNVYTTRQLLQLFERAFGHFNPRIEQWERSDGVLVDPFRPQVEPSGFQDVESLNQDRRRHLKAVRRMFEELDVFVFTLGLTECWEFIEDGSILPLAPGGAGGEMDSNKYAFRNFSKHEAQQDLELFLTKLKKVNPNAKVILTVSPVPLMATYEKRHVLVSTTVSKSVLRVVEDEVSATNEHVHYFPSYEIITGNFNRGSYFKEDLREVDENGVDHVMRLFMKHFTFNSDPTPDLASSESSVVANCSEVNENAAEILNEIESVSEIFCDEEALDNEVVKRH